MAHLHLQAITKKFGGATAVQALDLTVEDGSFLALLGPSGCGKTTVLRLIAGFETLTEGTIRFDDRVVSAPGRHLPPERRRVGIVFQSYALWPHMTVAENVGYPLRVAGQRGATLDGAVARALDLVGLGTFGDRPPAELSGGQRQRVALARCLVMAPAVTLLDEPLANLDVHLRAAMEEAFLDFHAKTGATMVYVTHDQSEAMALADRIAVMNNGRLEQVAAPEALYRCPATEMVARFIGEGTLVDGVIERVERDRCVASVLNSRMELRCRVGQTAGPATVCLRPRDLVPSDTGIAITIRRVVYRGGYASVTATTTSQPDTRLVLALDSPPPVGTAAFLACRDGWVVPEKAAPEATALPHEPTRMAAAAQTV